MTTLNFGFKPFIGYRKKSYNKIYIGVETNIITYNNEYTVLNNYLRNMDFQEHFYH